MALESKFDEPISAVLEDTGLTRSEIVRGRLEGWYPAGLAWKRVQVDANGVVQVTASGGGGGSVTQGTVPWLVDGSAHTQPISAVSLPLPTGAAKDSTLTDGSLRVGGSVAITAATLPLPTGASLDSTSQSIRDRLPTALAGGRLDVSLGAAPAAIDVGDRSARLLGHTTVDNVSIAITAATLPLPAGAAKDSTLTDGSQRVGGSVAITAAALPLPAGAAQEHVGASDYHSTRITNGTTFLDPRDRNWTVTETVPVSAASLPLPSGAATDSTAALIVSAIREATFDAWLAREEALFA